MSSDFNAYHKWLGIPPHEQPPHHYRLLGIGLFEKNADVIASAADRQMAHVKSFQSGANAAISQKLLNEIAAARVCLLNAEQKTVYDANLRAKLQAAKAQKAAKAANVNATPAGATVDDGLHALGIDVAPVTTASPYQRRKQGNSAALIGYAVVGILIIGVGAVFVAIQNSKPNTPVIKTSRLPPPTVEEVDPPAPPKSADTTPTAKPETPEPKPAVPVEPKPATPTKGPPKVKPSGSWTSADDLPPTPEPKPESEKPAGEKPANPPLAEPTAPAKLAVPAPESREKAKKLVLELFANDYTAAKSQGEKAALANKLLAATASAGDDAVGRFMLIEQARQAAIEAGDANVAMSAVDELTAAFTVDSVALTLNTFQQLAPQTKTPGAFKGFAERALGGSEAAVSAEKFPAAATLVDLAVAAAKKANDPALLKEVNARAKQFAEQRVELEKIAAARQVLTTAPDDPEANTTLGRYLVFVRNDWERGLPHLAKSTDASLQTAAADDLKNPSESAEQLKVADGWWTLATPDNKDRAALRQRAAHWYSQSVTKLVGLEKARVEKRLDELAGTTTTTGTGPAPVVAPFTPEVARERQLQWARQIKVSPQRTSSIGLKLALIPPGEFTMGSPATEDGRRDDEGPAHKVKLTKPYYLGVEEVTVGQFTLFVTATQYQTDAEKAVVDAARNSQMNDWRNMWRGFGRGRGMGGGPPGPPGQNNNNNNNNSNNNSGGGGAAKILTWKNPPFTQTKESPVVNVSWNDAVAFCKWLSKKDGIEYRLPTEAEWEFAARAGATTRFSFGEEAGPLGTYAWYSANSRQMPHPGSQKKGNQFGLVDMLGNAWEWVGDYYGPYSSDKAVDPTGTAGGRERAVRGGGFADEQIPRCAARQMLAPNHWDATVGFRVVAIPPAPKE